MDFNQQVLYCAGTVSYPSGEPAAGIFVRYFPGHHQEAGRFAEVKTDAKGRYAIIEGRDLLIYMGGITETNSIIARDLGRNLAAAQDFHMTTTNVDMVLQPGITLSGFVKDIEGAPISGAEVRLLFQGSSQNVLLEGQLIKVNEAGHFSVSALPRGREFYISGVTAKGYGCDNKIVRAKDTQTNHYELSPFVLKRADKNIAGRVVDGFGKPLAEVIVYFRGEGQPENFENKFGYWPYYVTKTDSEGTFSFDAVCDAPLWVHAHIEDSHGNTVMAQTGAGGMEVKAGDTNIVIQLRPPATQATR